jgi:hypothetical protein
MNKEELRRRYWRALFDADDCVCVAKYPGGTSLRPAAALAAALLPWAQFVGINAFASGSRRADRNVSRHRSFLLEFDRHALDEQRRLVDDAGLPWTACVFSGNRSLHFIVTLAEPVTADAYRRTAAALLAAFPDADRACGNPSRLSRYPGAMRLETGKEQELLAVKERVAPSALAAWLAARPRGVTLAAAPKPVVCRLRNRTLGFLAAGAEANRNLETFMAACDFAENGYSQAEALARLSEVLPLLARQKDHPFTAQEMAAAVASAYRRVARQAG